MDKLKYYTKNKYGISIVKCCASCKHKQADSRVRLGLNGEGSVPSDYLCKAWEMSEGLDNAGKGGGKVKKKDYFEFCNNVSITTADLPKYISVKDAKRAEYEEIHGGIYWDM